MVLCAVQPSKYNVGAIGLFSGVDSDYSTSDELRINRTLTETRVAKTFQSIRQGGSESVSLGHLSVKECKNFCEDSPKISHEICVDESICTASCLEKSVDDKNLCRHCSISLKCVSSSDDDFSDVKSKFLRC